MKFDILAIKPPRRQGTHRPVQPYQHTYKHKYTHTHMQPYAKIEGKDWFTRPIGTVQLVIE